MMSPKCKEEIADQPKENQNLNKIEAFLSFHKPHISLFSGVLLSRLLLSFFRFLLSSPVNHPRLRSRAFVLKSLVVSFLSTCSSVRFFRSHYIPLSFQSILGLLAGHFLHDLFANRDQWRKQKSTFLHHLLSFFLTWSLSSYSERTILKCKAPHFLFINLSTIFLNLGWLAQEAHLTHLTSLTEGLHTISFIFTRLLMMPYLILNVAIFRQKTLSDPRMQPLKRALFLFQFLMFYWGIKAVKRCR